MSGGTRSLHPYTGEMAAGSDPAFDPSPFVFNAIANTAPTPISPDRLWAGVQPAPLVPLNYTSGTSDTPPRPADQPAKDAELLARLIFAEAAAQHKEPGVYESIAHTVMNRIGQPGFKNSVPGVIFQIMPKQFNSVGGKLWNDAADPSSLAPENAAAYADALSKAKEVLSARERNLPDPTNGATFFYSSETGEPPVGFFSDKIKSGVLVKAHEARPFFFFKEARRR